MALSATFQADFQSFTQACVNAEVSLKTFEQGAGKVETSLNRMTASLSGTKLIQDATIMAEAVDRIGGTSKLTDRELARLGNTAKEAAAKMKALGMDVPNDIWKIENAARQAEVRMGGLSRSTGLMHDTAKGAATGVGGFAQSLGAVDKALAVMGIHIGPEMQALREFGVSSQQTASQLGLVATGGLVLAAGIGGWKLGRMAAEFLGTDQAIGNATAKLLGWGDVAKETAGAAADVLERAGQRAKHAVDNMAESIALNGEIVKEWRSNVTISADQVAYWERQIAGVRAKGELSGLTEDLKSQNFAVADLAKRYGLSVEALEYFTRAQAKAAEAEKAAGGVVSSNLAKESALREQAATFAAELSTRTAKVEAESVTKTATLWADTHGMRLRLAGQTAAAQIAANTTWFNDEVAKLNASSANYQAHYDGLVASAQQAADAIALNTQTTSSTSIAAAKEQMDREANTLNYMLANSSNYTRATIDHQREIRDATRDAYRAMGDGFDALGNAGVDAADRVAERTRKANEELEKMKAAADKAAAALRAMGSSVEYDLTTNFGRAQVEQMNPGVSEFLAQGYSLQQAMQLRLARLYHFTANVGKPDNPRPPSGTYPGFAEGVQNFRGGPAIVGERGPELLNLPPGSDVIPLRGGRGSTIVNVTVDPGAVVLNYPIMRDRQAMSEIGQVVGEAMVQRMTAQGWRPPLAVRR